MAREYKYEMIKATDQLINDIMIFNFSKHKVLAKWLKVKPVAAQLFHELDDSGEENLRKLALRYKELVEAAEKDGLYQSEIRKDVKSEEQSVSQ
jgi:hypothetical protein